MPKVKIHRTNSPANTTKFRLELPVVLSLAGIFSVAGVIGVAAFNSRIGSEASVNQLALPAPSTEMATRVKSDIAMKIARLDKKLAELSAQLKTISMTQTTTSSRVEKIEEAFTPTASISRTAPAPSRSSPYFRILETGWDADDMVTRAQKRNRIAMLKSEAVINDIDQTQGKTPSAKPRYAVELNSYENIITARNAWKNLNEVHGILLNKLEPNLLPILGSKDKGSRVKLVVGPIKTAAKAAQVCSVLRSNGRVCQERLFSASNITVVSAPQNRTLKSTEQ